MKWNEVLAYVLVVIFTAMLFTVENEQPFDFLSEYSWVKYEHDGFRTACDDELIVHFNKPVGKQIPIITPAVMSYNDSLYGFDYYIGDSNTVYLPNVDNIFFKEKDVLYVRGDLFGRNDIILTPFKGQDGNDLIFHDEYIYLKRNLPYQYWKMEIKLKTKFDVGDEVIINDEIEGTVMGIKITIQKAPGSDSPRMLIMEKVYLVDVSDEIDEFDEDMLKLKENDE